MFYDADVYSFNNLKAIDKTEINVIEAVKKEVLNKKVIEDFIDYKRISGEVIQKLYRDTLVEFMIFLQERMEYYKVDKIIEKIDSYSEEELSQLYAKAKMKETLEKINEDFEKGSTKNDRKYRKKNSRKN